MTSTNTPIWSGVDPATIGADLTIVRLVGALMLEQNDEWAVCRRYMSLETLAAMSDDPAVRLKAIPAASS